MDERRADFYQKIFESQKGVPSVPPNQVLAAWADSLICLLFPERADCFPINAEEVEHKLGLREKELAAILAVTETCREGAKKAHSFFRQLPELYHVLNTDIEAILSGDPAAKTRFEIIRAYPGFFAIAYYRIAHGLLLSHIPHLPRILTEHAHGITGIDIHPGAVIGEYFCIDHGSGTVIGESTFIGNHVKIYQGVTLGALSVEKTMMNSKRHPTVEDGVVIYSNATILGGGTVIGANSIIGGNVWLTRSIPPNSKVYHRPSIDLVEQDLLE
ncbi:serine acetyltransferase [Niabella ginsenosidivorans]|uniref:Serine acetyltransferase n=1 Tax=Niabella ginsenosidivorans TaxID=1176587 RepID=A0A1A9I185_9BACT|nr:serine acetyltransferase [Niabella ginsenosidivorans]ANH81095.1 serine acetyltransferase [Niabella ginsenosidivorans]